MYLAANAFIIAQSIAPLQSLHQKHGTYGLENPHFSEGKIVAMHMFKTSCKYEICGLAMRRECLLFLALSMNCNSNEDTLPITVLVITVKVKRLWQSQSSNLKHIFI